MISSVFGFVWTQSAASGLSGAASGVIRTAGILVGLTIFLLSAFLLSKSFSNARLQRTAPAETEPSDEAHPGGARFKFSPLTFVVIVVLEVAAIRGGTALLGATGGAEYQSAMVALIVGIHFAAFGRLFWAGFYWIALALIIAAVAGFVTGLAGGGVHGIDAVSGLIAAASLFGSGVWALVWSFRRRPESS